VNDVIDRPNARLRFLKCVRDGREVGDINMDTERANTGRRLLDIFVIISDDNTTAFGEKTLRGRPADAARPADDNRNMAGKMEVHDPRSTQFVGRPSQAVQKGRTTWEGRPTNPAIQN